MMWGEDLMPLFCLGGEGVARSEQGHQEELAYGRSGEHLQPHLVEGHSPWYSLESDQERHIDLHIGAGAGG